VDFSAEHEHEHVSFSAEHEHEHVSFRAEHEHEHVDFSAEHEHEHVQYYGGLTDKGFGYGYIPHRQNRWIYPNGYMGGRWI